MARKPRQPCLKCGKKRCSEPNTFCKPCELQVRIDTIDVAAEREKIIAHYEEHHASKYSHGKFVGRLNKPKYKLFVLKKDVGKCGGERWFFRGDVSLGYPQWAKELKKIGGKYGKYERVDVMEVRTSGGAILMSITMVPVCGNTTSLVRLAGLRSVLVLFQQMQ